MSALQPLTGYALRGCKLRVRVSHYTHTVPSGKSYWFLWEGAIVCFSIPANPYLGRFLLKRPCRCWELSRLWAADGHGGNLLTQAISRAVDGLLRVAPDIDVLVAFADPNVGHLGYVYRAASWVYTGQSEESRGYLGPDGQVVARRAFHSGGDYLALPGIKARGFREVRREGKHRFARGVTRLARRELHALWGAVPFPMEVAS